jgi:sodium/proline symporter
MIGLYLAVIVLLCIASNHITHNLSDFVLGGRRLSAPVVAMGACASDMSSWLVMALPAVAWLWGWHAIWVPIGLIIGAYCNWTFVAARLRIYTEILDDALTIPDYLVRRFDDGKGVLRAMSALVVLVFFIGYTASGLVAASLVVQTIFHISYGYALLTITMIFALYTVLGGFLAISWVDFFQGALVFCGLIILLACLKHLFPAWSHWPAFMSRPIAFSHTLLHHHLMVHHGNGFVGWLSKVAWGLGYFGQIHILVRFMAIKNVRNLCQAKWIAIGWMAVAMSIVVLLGMLGFAIFMPEHAHFNHQLVVLMLVKHFFSSYSYGLAVALILSVIMSALAAQLLVSSSALTEDLYRVYIRPQAGKFELLTISRISVVMIAFIAAYFAANPNSSVYQMVSYAWSGLGAAFGPVILISLYYKAMTHKAAIAGMLSGAITVIIWVLLRYLFGGIFMLYELIPGFMVSCTFIFLISGNSRAHNRAIVQAFQAYENRRVNLNQ